jgi:hypothetical protein
MLDEAFRQRVAEVTRADDGAGLDDEACRRILARVGAEGPGLVRRARRNRMLTMVAGPVLAAAAAVALVLRAHPGHALREAVTSKSAAGGALACASRSVPSGARDGFVSTGHGARLDLGRVALAASTAGSQVRLAEASACHTVVALESGTITVHAKDLGGGTFVVHARDADVTVRGTIFGVEQDPDSLGVEVVEGRVEVSNANGTQFVGAGERLLISRVGVARGKLSDARVRELRAAVDANEVIGLDTLERVQPDETTLSQGPGAPKTTDATPPVKRPETTRPAPSASSAVPSTSAVLVTEPEVAATGEVPQAAPVATPSDLLAQAEEARRAHDYGAARDLYRRAAEGAGATAEAAWVALARMELGLGHSALALAATKQRQERFGRGTLEPEALWIDVRAYRQSGDLGRARQLAEGLVRTWPSSPQARAAQRWLSGE